MILLNNGNQKFKTFLSNDNARYCLAESLTRSTPLTQEAMIKKSVYAAESENRK